jgi:hypothetical protein
MVLDGRAVSVLICKGEEENTAATNPSGGDCSAVQCGTGVCFARLQPIPKVGDQNPPSPPPGGRSDVGERASRRSSAVNSGITREDCSDEVDCSDGRFERWTLSSRFTRFALERLFLKSCTRGVHARHVCACVSDKAQREQGGVDVRWGAEAKHHLP